MDKELEKIIEDYIRWMLKKIKDERQKDDNK